MPGIVCSFCQVDLGRKIENLTAHLHYDHSFLVSRRRGFKCGQEGCLLEFQLFSSLRRHLITSHHHLVNSREEDDEEREDLEEPADDYHDLHGEDVPMEEDVPEEEEFQERTIRSLSRMAANVVLDMRSNSAVTGAVLSRVFDYLGKSVNILVSELKTDVEEALQAGNVNQETTNAVLSKFCVKNPFDKLESIDQSVHELKKHFKYVEPVQIQLDERTEYYRNKDGEFVPKKVRDTHQYIPILQVIELVLSSDIIRDLIVSERDAADGYMEKFRDGEHFKNHPLFSTNIGSIQLQIYYDDLEVVNALGSRTAVHKLGAFYLRILNLPHHINSTLGGIHLFLLCYSNDLKKYSFRQVLRPFLLDLKKLEGGVPMSFKEEEFVISGTVAAVCGDGLAVHELFGLLGPSCRFFCRECSISREDILAGRIECEEYRNREEYALRIQRLKDNPYSAVVRTQTGLNEECALHESAFFHMTENHIFDPMHDFLEGICPYEVKLVLNYFVENGNFDVQFLNERIHSFAYGITEIKNKPSSNITLASLRDVLRDHALKQKASQMMLLVRALPFLLSDKVLENDPNMKLILLLLDIMSIVFAPKVHHGTLPLLETLIREHNDLFQQLFPEARFINKHHHVTHYPRFIQKMGPALHHSCMRFEGKHHDLVRHGSVCCNFINLPKTLARVCQITQSKYWGDPEIYMWEKIHTSGGARCLVSDTPYCNELVAGFDVNLEDYVFVPESAEVLGTDYRRNTFVVLQTGMETEENLPTFGKIKEVVIVHTSAAVLVVSIWTTLFYEESLRSFAIMEETPFRTTLVLTSDLPDFRPMSSWMSFRDGDSSIYLCPRTSFC